MISSIQDWLPEDTEQPEIHSETPERGIVHDSNFRPRTNPVVNAEGVRVSRLPDLEGEEVVLSTVYDEM